MNCSIKEKKLHNLQRLIKEKRRSQTTLNQKQNKLYRLSLIPHELYQPLNKQDLMEIRSNGCLKDEEG